MDSAACGSEEAHPLLLLLQHVLVHEVLLLEQELLLLLQGCLLLRHILWWHSQPRLHPSAQARLAWRLLHATMSPWPPYVSGNLKTWHKVAVLQLPVTLQALCPVSHASLSESKHRVRQPRKCNGNSYQ